MCRKISAFLLIVLMALGLSACEDVTQEGGEPDSSLLFQEEFQDDTLSQNFKIICDYVEIDPKNIKNMEKTDDWAGGPRYSFSYQGVSFKIYCNMDSTIETLKLGPDTDIFKRGFQPYSVVEYILSKDEEVQLEIAAEDTVKLFLNYPETADFHLMDWGFGKNHDLYSVSGKVTAKNAFGVKEDIIFSIKYHLNNNKIKPVYVALNGSIQVDELGQYKDEERPHMESDNQIVADTANAGSGIILEDGKMGEYGKEDKVGNETYIDYYVPAGNYDVTNLAKWCKIFVIDNKTNEPVMTIELSETNEKKQLTIQEDEHIELTIHGKVSLDSVA